VHHRKVVRHRVAVHYFIGLLEHSKDLSLLRPITILLGLRAGLLNGSNLVPPLDHNPPGGSVQSAKPGEPWDSCVDLREVLEADRTARLHRHRGTSGWLQIHREQNRWRQELMWTDLYILARQRGHSVLLDIYYGLGQYCCYIADVQIYMWTRILAT